MKLVQKAKMLAKAARKAMQDDDKVEFTQDNPKKFASDAYCRYEEYCHAKSIMEARFFGARPADLRYDERAGYMRRDKQPTKHQWANKKKRSRQVYARPSNSI